MPGREETDVVVVGAGLAGLACARRLAASGLAAVVLEASDAVGGRLRTDVVDGVTVDRGFALLNPSYPEAARVLDLGALHLRPFVPGVLLVDGEHRALVADPRRRPTALPGSVRALPGSPVDLARFAAHAARVGLGPVPQVADDADRSLGRAWAGFGGLTTELLVPFLTGVVFGDPSEVSARFGDLLLRSFVRGTPAVPASGMQRIPEQLGRGVDVRLGTTVRAVTPTTATTDEAVWSARAVVVATEAPAAAALLPGLEVPRMRPGTTFWHLADAPDAALTAGLPVLVVERRRTGPVVNTVVVSSAAPGYGARGRALVASTTLGTDARDDDVRAHLSRLHGTSTDGWDTVAVHRIPGAVPAVAPGTPLRSAPTHDGVFVAGDHRDTASIQGALVSGRRIADAVRGTVA